MPNVSVLKKKSEENLQAIDILISSKLKAPVIHCAYYSSLQLVIHYFYEYCGITEEEVKFETSNGGSHNYYLNKLVNEITILNKSNALAFHKYFSNFKRKRNDADYSNNEISESDLALAKEKALNIKKFFIQIEHGKCEDISSF
jgi:ankyrin repeat protein